MGSRFLEANLVLMNNLRVKCSCCGTINILVKNSFDPQLSCSEEASMGTRNVYEFFSERSCSSCGNSLCVKFEAWEYPPGAVDYVSDALCENCILLSTPQIEVPAPYGTFDETGGFFNQFIARKDEIKEPLYPCINVEEGQGMLLLPNGVPVRDRQRTISFVKDKQHLADILIDETGTIRFDGKENQFALGVVLGINPQRTAMQVLGRVAEAIIVRRCAYDMMENHRWFELAFGSTVNLTEISYFTAIGTGLKSTKLYYPHHYNPHDPQRDIIWVNKAGYCACIRGDSIISGIVAGLQIKASTNGTRYILSDIINDRYVVPIVYFPINNDFELLCQKLQQKGIPVTYSSEQASFLENRLLINGSLFDPDAFSELKLYMPLIMDLMTERISAGDFVKEAYGTAPLQNAILATVLQKANVRIIS